MKKIAQSCLAALSLVILAGFAPPADEPGVPGTPNCYGQTMAYLAQLGKTAGVDEARGLGQLSKYTGYTIQELRQIAKDYCGS